MPHADQGYAKWRKGQHYFLDISIKKGYNIQERNFIQENFVKKEVIFNE